MYRKIEAGNIDMNHFSIILSLMTTIVVFVVFALFEKNTYWRLGLLFSLISSFILFLSKMSFNFHMRATIMLFYLAAFSIVPALYFFVRFFGKGNKRVPCA